MSRFDDTQRERLAALADVLMPSGAGMPAASAVDIHHAWIDQALDAVPMMAGAVELVLGLPGDPDEVIEALRLQQPDVFMAFTFVLSGAYFMHPLVRKELGYQGLAVEANPPLEGEAEYYLEEGLLEPVLARGPFYRQVPGDS